MKRALVLTVGTGTGIDSDIVQPLKKSISRANADRVVLLVSTVSLQHAERIVAELALGERATIRLLTPATDPDDVEQCFLVSLAILRELHAEGICYEDVETDFTTGTKAMTAGLVLAAVSQRCGTLRYISGRREHGVVVAGTERFLSIPPTQVLAQQDVKMAVRLFEALQFEAARKLLGEINPGLLDEYGKRLHTGLTSLVDAYDAWDKFDHTGFRDRYRKPDADLRELASFAVEDNVRGAIGQMASASSKPPSAGRKTTISPDHLADLWNNAQRRMREGKLDDAMARLYRLTEMIAQYVLDSEYGIDTSDVDLSALPAELSADDRTWLEAKAVRTGDQGNEATRRVELGLRDDYRLLAGLGHVIGPLVPPFGTKPTQLSQLLDTRNASILAHGTTPISSDDACALAEQVRKLAVKAIPGLEARCALLQFPWLNGAG